MEPNDLHEFVKSVIETKPNLSDFGLMLRGFSVKYGDVDFNTLLDALTEQYLPEAKPEDVVELEPHQPTTNKKVAERVAHYLAEHKTATFRELCVTCGKNMGEQSFRYHLNRMLECGAVIRPYHGLYALSEA